MLNYGPDTFRYAKPGDIVSIDGRRHKLLKKTTTAVSVKRYYWFDALFDKLIKKEAV
jgi:hypothetical protein